MAFERERRYLASPELVTAVKRLARYIPHTFWQVYFTTGEREVRIRIVNGDSYFLTMKRTLKDDVRREAETAVTPDFARQVIDMCDAASVEKVRWAVEDGWEVNQFKGMAYGLVLVERELGLDEPVPDVPSWMKPYIVRDVTDDVRYTSGHLAEYGIPTE